MKLFDPDGPLMSALSKLADIVVCNLLFLFCSLPVFTIGASLSALFTCMQRSIEDRDDEIVIKTFLRAFRTNFKRGTGLWFICLGAAAFLAVFRVVSGTFTGMLFRVYRVGFFALTIAFLFGFQYLFPLQARYENKVKYTLRNAWLLSVAALPWTLLSIALPVAAVYVSFFMNPNGYRIAVYIWFVCGFGLIAYLNSFFFRLAFRKLGDTTLAAGSSERSEGAVFTDEEHRSDDIMVQESTYSNPNWNRREEPKPEKTKKKRRRR